MEPTHAHITEFASHRYFEKLKQQNEGRDHAQCSQDGTDVHKSTFILPIRALDKTTKKTRSKHNKLRSILPSRSLPAPTPAASAKQKSLGVDQLFLSLPNELKIQIIASLPLSDVLALRLVSRSWLAMVSAIEYPIARYYIEHHIPAYAKRLYPVPETPDISFHYLCGVWHRLHVAAKLAFLICDWTTKEIFLRNTEAQRLEFAPQRERMRRRLIPLLFTVFHFFETYRTLHLRFVEEHGHGLLREAYTLNPIEVKVMNMYDDKTLLHVHQIFPLVVASFCRRLRPPSYVGRLERSLRGYLKDKPADEIYTTTLCIGGLRQVERFWEIKGYNTRRGAVDTWYNSVVTDPCLEPAAKPRRGFRGLSRRKSSVSVQDASNAHNEPSVRTSTSSRRRPSDGATSRPDSAVLATSMSAGMPMSELSRDQLRLLLPDLPVLQKLWLPTAEALILQRRIVARDRDIKRNAQVMLELIRDDGVAPDDDEWWYGHSAAASVRPPVEAIEEDPIE